MSKSKLACVLLVDDDEIANFIHQSFLEEVKIADQIVTAQNGLEALQLIQEGKINTDEKPTLVLLDINMPVMNGYEFLDAFRDLDPEKKQLFKIVVLSSSNNTTDVDKAYQKGAIDYLNKPLEKAKVNALVDRI